MEVEKQASKIVGIKLILVVATIVIIAGTILLLWPRPKYVEVSFDSNGGTPVESIVVKEGTIITLPETEKTGYTFAGWYLEDVKLEKTILVKENMHLIAKWGLSPVTAPEEEITFVITFDSNGGSTIEKITIKCGEKLQLPKKPERDKYSFLTWKDRYGNDVNEGALLSCEDQTLTATWIKKKEYICSEGYRLEGTECITTMAPELKCEEEELDIGNNQCLADYKADSKCGSKTVFYQNGSVEKTEGDYLYNDLAEKNMCYYGIEESLPEDVCIATYGEGHYNNKCYIEIGEEVNECPANHIYYTEEQLKRKTNLESVEAGCYVQKGLTSFCEKDYVLENNSCIKRIPATEKK